MIFVEEEIGCEGKLGGRKKLSMMENGQNAFEKQRKKINVEMKIED